MSKDHLSRFRKSVSRVEAAKRFSPAIKSHLQEFVDQHKAQSESGFDLKDNRASLLFSGSSGTGKTMAASWLANQLGTSLSRIDLGLVRSKYIGETEKNLLKIFDEAAEAKSILFFDEADALFGKRADVSDAHDRYANQEVSYLLQRIENYSGVSILTINAAAKLDQAFKRRFTRVIKF